MSKPRKRWWGYVRRVLYDYPRLRAELDELQQPHHYGESAGHTSGISRQSEILALHTLPDPDDQRDLEAVEAALAAQTHHVNGGQTLRLVRMVFFHRSHTLEGAAQVLHISYHTAERRQNAFIRLVAEKMGLTDKLAACALKRGHRIRYPVASALYRERCAGRNSRRVRAGTTEQKR